MKKHFFKSLFLGAFALVGMIGISSCSDKDDPGSSNPQFNKETKEVNTSFVFSVSTGKQADTRQTVADVQNDGGFLGMDKAIMLTYDTNGDGWVQTGTSTGQAGADATKRFDFATLLSPNEITATNSHRILDLALPIGTDAMLFYGSAHKTGTDAQQGLITYTTTGNKANAFTFALTSISGQSGVAAKFNNGLDYLAAILTELVGVDDGATTSPTSWQKLGTDLTAGTATQTESEKNLGKAFNALTTIGTSEYRAGSLAAILGMMSDLYKTVDMIISQNTATTEPKAFPIATNLKGVMDTYFDPETNTNNSTTGYSDLKSTLVAPTGFTLSVTADDMGDFPAALGLPYGTALMSYNKTTNAFSAVTTDQALIDATATGAPSQIGTYMFPAELMYRANSSLRTSDTDKAVADFPNGTTNWDTDTQWTGLGWPTATGPQEVTASTRAAALAQNINYGTAMLETQVTLDDDPTTGTVTAGTLADNKAALTSDTSNAEIDPSNLELIGVLVGGQPDAANWEFLPTNGNRNAVIYDNVMNQTSTTTYTIPTTGKNYTMVLDNYNTSGTQDAEVRVALEFKNNGPSFYGRDNLVREGGVFYLVGKLTLASAKTSALQWDTYYQLPPLDTTGKTTQTNRVFIQDHITAANFKMDYTSLQKAYVTVPDLRSGQLTFGLSVDISWKNGLSFESVLGTN